MIQDSVRNLAYLFRTGWKARPVILLGAGSSFRSGIPLSEEAVRRIAQAAYARFKFGLNVQEFRPMLSDWLPFLQNQPWFISASDRFGENFPLAVEHFLTPREFRREFFQEMIRSSQGGQRGLQVVGANDGEAARRNDTHDEF